MKNFSYNKSFIKNLIDEKLDLLSLKDLININQYINSYCINIINKKYSNRAKKSNRSIRLIEDTVDDISKYLNNLIIEDNKNKNEFIYSIRDERKKSDKEKFRKLLKDNNLLELYVSSDENSNENTNDVDTEYDENVYYDQYNDEDKSVYVPFNIDLRQLQNIIDNKHSKKERKESIKIKISEPNKKHNNQDLIVTNCDYEESNN